MIMGMTTFLTHFDEIRSRLSIAPSPKIQTKDVHTPLMTGVSYRIRSKKKSGYTSPRGATDTDKFFYRVERIDGHWLWRGYIDKDGYGRFSAGGRVRGAHQWSYENFVRKIELGEVVDHLCRIRHCVNPECLEAISNEENVRRGHRSRSAKTHCSKGHSLAGSNIRILSSGYRVCVSCEADKSKRARLAYYDNRAEIARGLNQPIVTCVNGHRIQHGWLRCKTCHSERERLARQLGKR